jgi:hypothetical protein
MVSNPKTLLIKIPQMIRSSSEAGPVAYYSVGTMHPYLPSTEAVTAEGGSRKLSITGSTQCCGFLLMGASVCP